MKYLVFGETIWDVYPDKQVIGGAPFNFSANSALLGDEVHFITGIGHDDLGDQALSHIAGYGIKTDLVCRNDKPTGQCIVTLDEKGVPQYRVLDGAAYDHVTVDEDMIAKIREIKPTLFYFNTLAQRCEVSRNAIRKILDTVRFEHIFCDVNIRPNCWDKETLGLCMSRASIVKISEEEAHFLTDCGLIDMNGRTFDQAVGEAFPNLKLLVYTMGAAGSAVYDFEHGTQEFSGEPEKVEVVSTVGAGDCYSASFVHTYLAGGSIAEAIRFATERSNVVVAHTEAIPWKAGV